MLSGSTERRYLTLDFRGQIPIVRDAASNQGTDHPFSFSLSMSFQVIVEVLEFLIVSSPLSLSCFTRNGLGVLSGGSPSSSRTVGQVVVPPS